MWIFRGVDWRLRPGHSCPTYTNPADYLFREVRGGQGWGEGGGLAAPLGVGASISRPPCSNPTLEVALHDGANEADLLQSRGLLPFP